MDKIDLKKRLKPLYDARAGTVSEIDVPACICVSGCGASW